MFKDKTVFVIGAGCSFEFGFPLGSELKSQIRQRATADHPTFFSTALGDTCLRRTNGNVKVASNTLRILREGVLTKQSIDRFLDFHKEDATLVDIGKLFIANEILRAERKSPLYSDATGSAGWVMTLWHAMSDGVYIDDPRRAFGNISFICFNYDRCLEYAFEAIVRGWLGGRGDVSTVRSMLEELEIIHPYGCLSHRVRFGEQKAIDDSQISLSELSEEIRLFTETEHGEVGDRIRGEVGSAHHIVFLGFGFEPMNMDVINPHRADDHSFRISGTVCGLSQRQRAMVVADIGSRFRASHLELIDTTTSTYVAQNAEAWARGLY